MKKVMFIGAHPDDIELSCGGVMKKLKDSGVKIFPVICTWGLYGGLVSERIKEQEESFELLSIKEYVNLNWKDTEVAVNGENVKSLEEIIAEQNPDLIFTHYPDDTHQDHRAVAEMVKSICYRKNKSLIYFDSNSSIGFVPDYFEEINWLEKEGLLKNFKSQIDRSNILVKAGAKNRLYGIQSGKDFAEGYKIERLIGGIL